MDPIADMFSIIMNAQAVEKKQAAVSPFSNLKFQILGILKKEGFILDAKKKGKDPKKRILVDLKYNEDGSSAVSSIKRISKPGRRVYNQYQELKPVRSGYGISIISTSKGLMTNKDARKQKIGGEVIAEVW
ncbi:MAG: 30S ribosomal protein S8 [Candidatus Paceibacterota bacterium]|jgi:small subunit ribosomal protein S8|nr:30S ribosomal protein S8 [Candidatus Paceibacterota bacterium]MDD4830777.1 30S ribosomal protein S8 [Candidatus Paceibacterota bacterium]MDD4875301.1 30S ribosomal protein S8 [Candidatus Paceibacterota bacterium]